MNQLDKMDDTSRREFIQFAAKAFLGVSVWPAAGALAAQQTGSAPKAKQVIYLFMNGAMSHLDTFDPKPGVEQQGPTKSIKTSVPGISISEHLPGLAKRMKKLNIIRSMSTATGAHQPGRYLMRTSYKEIASTRHPSLGAWVQRVQGRMNKELPGSVLVGNSTGHPSAGFLDAQFAPVPIGSASTGLRNTKEPKYLGDSQFHDRMKLTFQFDRPFREKYQNSEVKGYTDLYREAIRLLKSKDLEAFDIRKEKAPVREAYGSHSLGQGCLLARRLLENGIRFVEVDQGGWDNHRDIFTEIPQKANQLDQAISALLDDLEKKTMLDETLIVLATEFGRTPKINKNAGRDHHPGAFSSLLAGGGTKGGVAWGRSDEVGFGVEDDQVSVQDFNATIAHAMGIPLDEEIYSPAGRPFTIARGGEPITGIF